MKDQLIIEIESIISILEGAIDDLEGVEGDEIPYNTLGSVNSDLGTVINKIAPLTNRLYREIYRNRECAPGDNGSKTAINAL